MPPDSLTPALCTVMAASMAAYLVLFPIRGLARGRTLSLPPSRRSRALDRAADACCLAGIVAFLLFLLQFVA